ncbi:related to pyridoxamine-phosphate oxidase [Phialocephala subalpina]|uniref:pyridoxal 5'-phosphate synthase n=1 Tax=Phialocephala subalpina TaxID=576137 RepID=A0A1L7XV30_9HELO|nr:related to pyridoxamine-phosphate oxidase [Phialocephala subalpina]
MADNANLTRTKLRDLDILDRAFPETDLDKFPDTPHDAFQSCKRCPDARILSLKRLDERGWHFTIQGDGPKAQQIAGNENVALTFYWPPVGRQIRLRGKATQLSEEECTRDFLEQPLNSRIAAVASKQSQVLESRGELLCCVANVKSAIAEGKHLAKLEWRVYVVTPSSVEFWQRSNDRLHQRLRFTAGSNSNAWVKELLWP